MEDMLRVSSSAAPVREQVAKVLRRAIVTGRFKPGQRLIERELVDLTNVSRTSVREALRLLESEGLVANIPNQGPIVAIVTIEEARQIYEVRAALEGLAGELFAVRGSADQLRRLDESLGRMRQLSGSDPDELHDEKDRFYAVLFEGAGNDVVAGTLSSLYARISMLRRTTLSEPGRPQRMLDEMTAILDALHDHDAGAAREACVRHVQNAAATAFDILPDPDAA